MSNSSENGEVEEPQEEFESRDLTIRDAYTLGANIFYLQFAGRYNFPIGSEENGGILEVLEDTQNKIIATDTSLTIASQIEDTKRRIYDHYGNDPDPNEAIDDSLGENLSQKAQEWHQLLSEKTTGEHRINIPNTGILDLKQLMYDPGRLFEERIWEVMDEEAQKDIIEACRSLPLRCTTASTMISLRAVEHYLRKWYEYETNEELERGTWGSVLDDLIEIYLPEEDSGAPVMQQLSGIPNVLSNIYYLKEKRDKVSHPDERPSEYEAVITLFMVSGTISEVIQEIGDVPESEERPLE